MLFFNQISTTPESIADAAATEFIADAAAVEAAASSSCNKCWFGACPRVDVRVGGNGKDSAACAGRFCQHNAGK